MSFDIILLLLPDLDFFYNIMKKSSYILSSFLLERFWKINLIPFLKNYHTHFDYYKMYCLFLHVMLDCLSDNLIVSTRNIGLDIFYTLQCSNPTKSITINSRTSIVLNQL